VTLTSLIEVAAGAPAQPALASGQSGKPSAPESAAPLFGDVAAFAARLEALFAQLPSPATPVSKSAAGSPLTSASLPSDGTRPDTSLPGADASDPSASAPASSTVTQEAPVATLVEKAAPASGRSERKAHITNRSPVRSQEKVIAAHPVGSRRFTASSLHQASKPEPQIAASTGEFPQALPTPGQAIPIAAPPPAQLPNLAAPISAVFTRTAREDETVLTTAPPLPMDKNAPATSLANSPAAYAAPPFSAASGPSVDSLPTPATNPNAVSERADFDPSRFVTGTLLPSPSDAFATGQPPSSPAPASHGAASPASDLAPRPHVFPTYASDKPAALRDTQLSGRAHQPATVSLAAAGTAPQPSSNRLTSAAPAQTAAVQIEPVATQPAAQTQGPPADAASSNHAPAAAPQASTSAAATPSTGHAAFVDAAPAQPAPGQAAPAQPAPAQPAPAQRAAAPASAVQAASAAQSAASTNLKAQPAASHSSPHSADPGAVLNIFPAPLSVPPVFETRSAQPVPQPAATAFSAQSTFAALDAAAASSATLFTHAGTRHAEAGYLDPTLGWVGVRAEVSGGALHAAIVPASSQAADILGAHLPALHTYVSQQHGLESTIDMSWQNNANSGSGSQHSAQQDPSASAGDDATSSMRRSTPASVAQPSPFASFDAAGAPPPASGGRYISVLA
jgi:trimeric autotransporter adhesin